MPWVDYSLGCEKLRGCSVNFTKVSPAVYELSWARASNKTQNTATRTFGEVSPISEQLASETAIVHSSSRVQRSDPPQNHAALPN